ncbi:MAG: UPF0147 family protein [Candidatus Woesearchaeota archaeon]
MTDLQIDDIIDFLDDLREDTSVPKNVKLRIAEVVEILKCDIDSSLKVDKVMHIFDELNDDSNIDSFTRTQLWNVVSMLESL